MTDDALRAVPLRYLTTKQAAEYLKLKGNSLEKMRSRSRGPKFRRHGRRVVYSITDLDAWSDARVLNCTSDHDPNMDPADVDDDDQITESDGEEAGDG